MIPVAGVTRLEEGTANARARPVAEAGGQYSLARILGIWALAAIPMGVQGWVVFPALSPDVRADPLGAGAMRMGLFTLGLIWQFVLCLLIVRREAGDLRWATVKRRLRLDAPHDPATGERRGRLWLWVVPLVGAIVVWEMALAPSVNRLWSSIFPFLAEPPGYGFDAVFTSPGGLARLVGAWWFFGLFVIFAVFNSVLGEEFLFRGVLLPKMAGVFGRWSWVANGVLFGVYHVHQPWGIVSNAVGGVVCLAFPSWRFRTTWMGVVVHSVQREACPDFRGLEKPASRCADWPG
jgi:membrane protease YdiL (CAAX protease family)